MYKIKQAWKAYACINIDYSVAGLLQVLNNKHMFYASKNLKHFKNKLWP